MVKSKKKRTRRVVIDPTELEMFSETPVPNPYWDDLYNPGYAKNQRKTRVCKADKPN